MQDKLTVMSQGEKKKFFTNDLIERMIRVEQRVCAHFGTYTPYYKTDYYKNLTSVEKESFENYLKSKKKKKFFFSSLFLIPLLAIGLLNFSMTGNVVKTGSNFSLSLIDSLLIFAAAGILIALIVVYIHNKRKERKFASHTSVIDNILIRKRLTRQV